MTPGRTLLGKWTGPLQLTKVTIWQTPEGFDVESNEHFEVANTRVFYDDVQLVTYHREYGALYLLITGFVSLGFLLLMGVIASLPREAWVVAVVFGVMGSPFMIAFLLRAAFGVDVVTIFGRRSKARLRYRFRKKKAREVYGHVCAAVRNAQRITMQQQAAMQPPPAESPAPPLPDSVFPPPLEQ